MLVALLVICETGVQYSCFTLSQDFDHGHCLNLNFRGINGQLEILPLTVGQIPGCHGHGQCLTFEENIPLCKMGLGLVHLVT